MSLIIQSGILAAPQQLFTPAGDHLMRLDSRNIDGNNNAGLVNGARVATWKNLGNSGADFTEATTIAQSGVTNAKGYLKLDANEQSIGFDGAFSALASLASKTAYNFIHQTGVFDLFLVFRRRGTETLGSAVDKPRLWGCDDAFGATAKGLFVGHNASGNIWVLLGGNAGVVNVNFTTSSAAFPIGTPYKVLVRGTGTQIQISHDFSTFETSNYANAFGTGDASNDYYVGACGPTSVFNQKMAQGDVFNALLYRRNLTAYELPQMNNFLQSQAGAGV